MRRPWNDLLAWHNALLLLYCLDELYVRTHIPITDARRSTEYVVQCWANGAALRSTPHPSLVHISLLEDDANDAGRRVTHWFKGSSGQWELVAGDEVIRGGSFTL